MSRFQKPYYQDRATKLAFNSSLDSSVSSDSFNNCNGYPNKNSIGLPISASSPKASREKVPAKNVINDIESYLPRDSVDVLSELKPGLVFTIRSQPDNKINANVEIDGRTYAGIGKSESLAKQAAAENALRDLFVDTIISTMTNNNNNDILCNAAEWKLLGSFAIFKLIEEWLLYYMSQTATRKSSAEISHESPSKHEKHDRHQSIVTSTPKSKDTPKPSSSGFKANKDEMILTSSTNATVLLNSLLGSCLQFQDLQVNKDRPPYAFSLLVHGIKYVGEPATSKRFAKQNVARKVLIQKFGYKFINK